jgi:glutaminyl-peptide cyclotransferase
MRRFGDARAAVMCAALATACLSAGSEAQRHDAAPVRGYTVVRSYPHDPSAFTQGLVYRDGLLYEGTGLEGQSTLRKVQLETGAVLRQHRLEPRYFGEGIAIWRDTIVQLTWKHGIAFVYDLETFSPVRTHRYDGEGWGLTHDGSSLIMSDGTSSLRFIEPETFRELRRLPVRDGGMPVHHLNELEYIKGEIWANVWQTERIARISASTGQVNGWIDARGLLTPAEARGVDVFNGIAYDARRDRVFVTGKLWPRLFEIKVLDAAR